MRLICINSIIMFFAGKLQLSAHRHRESITECVLQIFSLSIRGFSVTKTKTEKNTGTETENWHKQRQKKWQRLSKQITIKIVISFSIKSKLIYPCFLRYNNENMIYFLWNYSIYLAYKNYFDDIGVYDIIFNIDIYLKKQTI